VHHPPYSLDQSHGGCPDIASALDHAMQYTKRIPHVVLSGHVHNYQRFTRVYEGREIPHVIDGRGGYANTLRSMHRLQKDQDGNYPPRKVKTVSEEDQTLDLTLESYDQDNPGFLKVTVTDKAVTGESYTVPFEGNFTTAPADSVTVSMDGKIMESSSGHSENPSGHGRGGHGGGRPRRP